MGKQTAPTKTQDAEDLAFEEILSRLEGVVESLEGGELPLEQALASFERGVSLARLGERRLDEAERRVEVLLRDGDGTRTRPLLDETAEEAEEADEETADDE